MSNSWLTRPVFLLLAGLGVLTLAVWPVANAQESSEQDDFDFDDLFGDDSSSSSSSGSSGSNGGDSASSSSPQSRQSANTNDGDVEAVPVQPVTAASKQPKEKTPPKTKREKLVEEIVVTSRKREESIQEIPLSVTPFTAAEMEQRGFTGLDDIAAATPGFTFEPFATGGAHGNAVIRGLAQQFTTSRIQNVSFFLDGVYLQRQSMLDLGLIDMERVEVVKGPQNALYGRNAFAGAVNYITLRPGATPGGYFSMGLGDNQRREYRISVNGPMDKNGTWFGKFSAGLTSYDGHTRNDHPLANADAPGPNQQGNLGGWDNESYSASLAFEPSNELRMRASYYRNDAVREASPSYSISGVNAARFGLRFDDQNDLNCNETTVNAVGDPSKTHTGFSLWCGPLPKYASDVAERTKDGMIIDPRAIGTIAKTDAVTLSAIYAFNDTWSLNYLYGFADHESYTDGGASDEDPLAGRGIVTNAAITAIDTQNRNGYEFINTSSSRPNTILESFSHELRFDWTPDDSPLRASAGLYHSLTQDQEWTALFIMDLCNDENEENIANCSRHISAPNTLAERTVITAGIAYDQYTRQHGGNLRGEWTKFEDEINAAFASVSMAFSDTVEGTLEARYTIESKAVERLTDSFMLAPGETVTYNPPQDPVLPGVGNSISSNIAVPFDSAKYRYFTPRGILNWQWADSNMIYLSAAKGVKSGGFNNAEQEDELTYDEAENWTYELGTKNTFLYGSITVNAAAFYVDWEGLQGGIPPAEGGLSTSDIIQNIGGAESLGFELESSVRFRNGISADIGLTINDAKYKEGTIYSAGDQETGAIHCDGVTCPADGAVGGNQLARTSKEQWSAGLNYRRDLLGWLFNSRIDTNYQSRQYLTPLNKGWVPERQITNASFGFISPSDQWELNFWGKNLTDEDYPGNAFVIGVFNQYMVGKGARRTFGGTVKYNF